MHYYGHFRTYVDLNNAESLVTTHGKQKNRNVKFEARSLSYIVDSLSKDKDIARPSGPDVSIWPIREMKIIFKLL